MPVWKEAKGWRYRFQVRGEKFNKAWFKTKAAARAAEEAHKAELKKAAATKTKTGMVFSELANEYLDLARRRFTPKTYKYKAFVFRSFIAAVGDLSLSQMSVSVLEMALRSRRTNINYNRHRKDLCALLTWAWKRQKIDQNPCFFLEKMPEPQFIRKIPTPEEMQRILLVAGEDRPLILILYHTLARIDEVLRMRWEDVNFQERTVRLWTRKRKGGEWAADTLPMNQVLYETLWGLWRSRQQAEWVFYNEKTGTRYNRRPKLMHTLCRQAGIPYFGFHAIRHYVASLLHDSKKVGVAQVSKLLRHQSKATTERYLQVIDPGSRAAVDALEGDFLGHPPMTPSHGENEKF
jgi:integrase